MIPKSKLMLYFDKKNNAIVIDDGSKWTTRMLFLLRDMVGLSDLQHTVINLEYGQLSIRSKDPSIIPQAIHISEDGKLKLSFTMIQHIHNEGVCKISHSDVFNITNGGIMTVSGHSRIRAVKNTRHLALSGGSFGYYIQNSKNATFITSGSYITKSDAIGRTITDPGNSIYVGCEDKLQKYSYCDVSKRSFKKLDPSKQLQLMSVDWIGSVIHPPKDKLKAEIVKLIRQGVEIPNNLGTILCSEMGLTGPELRDLQQLVAKNTSKRMCYR